MRSLRLWVAFLLLALTSAPAMAADVTVFGAASLADALKEIAADYQRDSGKAVVTSECPLAGLHIAQGIERLGGEAEKPAFVSHPISLVARAYGLEP